MVNAIIRRRQLLLGEGEEPAMRYVDCVPYTKVITVDRTASGFTANGYVVSGGVLVELDDSLNSNDWTPNYVEITFLPVSASIFDSNIDSSGYAFDGYGWVHPWDSSMQASSTFRGVHVKDVLESGSAAYGWVAPLGVPIKIEVNAGSDMKKLRLFNMFQGTVTALINYTFKKAYKQNVNTETGTCGS